MTVRRSMCRGAIVWGAVAAVVCGVATGCGRQQTPAPATVTVTSAPVATESDAPGESGAPSPSAPTGLEQEQVTTVPAGRFETAPGEYYFRTPSGNIFCGIRTAPDTPPVMVAGCQARVSVPPAVGPACTNANNDAHLVSFVDGRAEHRCTNQGIFVGVGDPPVLRYGQALAVGGYRCTSRVDGVTCVTDDDSAGFMLSREVNRSW